jgi:hypothetical protein
VSGFKFVANGNTASTVTDCAGTSILGGFAAYSTDDLYKVYNNLPDHSHLFVSVKIYYIDSWDNELFWITVDGARISAVTQRTA